jgi:acyl-CoA dehydrogenase
VGAISRRTRADLDSRAPAERGLAGATSVFRPVPSLSVMAHLAKYWSAEFAAQAAKWCIEVHGGLGVLEEYRVQRWLRGGMVLAIGDSTTLQQFLDALEMMVRNQAHRLLIQRLQQYKRIPELDELQATIDRHMMLPAEESERELESLINQLAQAPAEAMLSELKAQYV